MMEYISREGTMEKVRRMPRTVNPDLVQYSLVKGIIAGMPAAEVTPVVRCRECKHLNVVNNEKLYAHCPKTNTVFLPFQIDTRTHFCSLGERR